MPLDRNSQSPADARLNDALAEWLRTAERDPQPDPDAFITRYPELAAALRGALADWSHFSRWTGPLRAALGAPPDGTPQLAADPTVCTPPDFSTWQGFGDYELLTEIGRGGMAVVFKARHRSLNRLVALKVLSGAAADDGERFQNEMEAVALLDHPNIVPIYETGVARPKTGAAEVPYFTMKLVEGGNLAQVVTGAGWERASPDTQRVAARLLAAVARAVHHAHQRGILHRDLKPANILLQKGEGGGMKGESKAEPTEAASHPSSFHLQPFVTDFGLARRLDRASELTHSGALVGTPSYMAPEQADGRGKAVTTATHVFGLGAILYALLTGRPPFRGDSLLGTLEQVKACAPVPPRSLNPGVDRDLETICLKCLAREPRDRYPSA
jgi:serine/threonine-protein kinase